MDYNETMEYYRKLNIKFQIGFDHGSEGERFQPGLTFGAFRNAYSIGYREGSKVRGMKIKAKIKTG